MNKVILHLTNLLNNIKEENNILLSKIDILEEDKVKMMFSHENVENIDFDLLEKYLLPEIKNSNNFKLAKELKDYFSIYKNESQIISSMNYVKELVITFQNAIVERINGIKSKIEEHDKVIKKYNEFIDYLKEYNNESFFDEEHFNLLNEIISNIEVDEEILEFYISIGKNNINTSKRSETKKFESEDIFEQIEKEENPLQEIIEETDLKDKLKKEFKSFNIEDYKELLVDNYYEVERIINKFKESFESFNSQEVINGYSAVEEGLDYFEILHNEEILIATVISIMDSTKKSNVDMINKVIEIFNNLYKEYYNFEDVDKENGISSTLSYFENRYGDQIKRISDFIMSYETAKEEEIISGLNDYFEGKFKYKDFLIIKDYIKINELLKTIKDNKISSDCIIEIEELLVNIKTYIFEKETAPNGVKTPNEVNPYQVKFHNYIAFFNKDDFLEDYEEMKDNYHDVSFNDLIWKLDTAIHHDLNSIQTQYSRPLNYNNKPGNIYKIRELFGGNIRVHYKVVETNPIDGHPIILICGFNYGNMDSSQKDIAINKSIRKFEKSISRYNNMLKIFDKVETYENLSEDAKKILSDGLEFYKELYDKVFAKDKELDGQDDVLSSEGGGRK